MHNSPTLTVLTLDCNSCTTYKKLEPDPNPMKAGDPAFVSEQGISVNVTEAYMRRSLADMINESLDAKVSSRIR
jgi:hypothetical protein